MNRTAAERLEAETTTPLRLNALAPEKTNIHPHANTLEIHTGKSWAAFFLAVVESACLFLVAAAKTGVLLGTVLGAIAGWTGFMHRDVLRIPLLLGAIIGSIMNLFLLWRAQHLRNAPAASWRKKPLTTRERFRIGLVLSLSFFTLIIAGLEIYIHRLGHHSLM